MAESFIIVRSTEDGISIDGPMPESELLRRLNEYEAWFEKPARFLSKVPPLHKGNFDVAREDEDALLILRAEVVVPKPESVVTKWAIR